MIRWLSATSDGPPAEISSSFERPPRVFESTGRDRFSLFVARRPCPGDGISSKRIDGSVLVVRRVPLGGGRQKKIFPIRTTHRILSCLSGLSCPPPTHPLAASHQSTDVCDVPE